jgi:hypothetical protein
MRRACVLLAAAFIGCHVNKLDRAAAASAASGPTCYEADHPLGLSHGGSWEGTSPDLSRFQLWPGGQARRAGLRTGRDAAGHGDPMGWRGEWRRGGDTLHVRLGTCCSSWTLVLVPEPPEARPRAYVGVATYGSDAVVVGEPAPTMMVHVREGSCPTPAA